MTASRACSGHRPVHARTRRRFLKTGAVLAAAGVLHSLGDCAAKTGGCTLGFGTYGMKDYPVEKAIAVVAETGFDSIELAVRPDWDSAPGNMSAQRRTAVRRRLEDRGLRLTSLMEYLLPARDERQHQKDCERLRRVYALGHDLSPDAPPLVQTVLGSGEWGESRNWLRERVADWVEIAEKSGAVLAVKPHRGGVMSRPDEAAWLIRQLDSTPQLRMVFDYSHYAYRDMPLEETVRRSLPWIGHVAVKDAIQQGGKVIFTLPAESGVFDYETLFRLLHVGGYQGDISCEVSSMVWRAEGYDARRAAEICYRNMAPVMRSAGVRGTGEGRFDRTPSTCR